MAFEAIARAVVSALIDKAHGKSSVSLSQTADSVVEAVEISIITKLLVDGGEIAATKIARACFDDEQFAAYERGGTFRKTLMLLAIPITCVLAPDAVLARLFGRSDYDPSSVSEAVYDMTKYG